jgi:hypothetical protein
MKKMMQATKPFRYATRALAAGETFEANRRDARTLAAIGKAREIEPKENVDGLREEALALGIKVDKRWGADRIREEIKWAQNNVDED